MSTPSSNGKKWTVWRDLQEQLKVDEGVRAKPYKDTEGKLTIGVGRNLTDVGLSQDEIEYLLENDVTDVFYNLNRHIPWWQGLPVGVATALANMCFNLGIGGLLKFEKMLAYLKVGNWGEAANEALLSRWAVQVGKRAERVTDAIRRGE